MLAFLAIVLIQPSQPQVNPDSYVTVSIKRRAVENDSGKLFLAKHNAYQVLIRNNSMLQLPGVPEVLLAGDHKFSCDTEEDLKKILPDGDWISLTTPQVSRNFKLSSINLPDFISIDEPSRLKQIDPKQPLKLKLQGVNGGSRFSITAIDSEDPAYFKGDFIRGRLPGFDIGFHVDQGKYTYDWNIDRRGMPLEPMAASSLASPLTLPDVNLPYQTNYVLEAEASAKEHFESLDVDADSICSTVLKTIYDPTITERGYTHWVENDHWYKAVSVPAGISWTDAESAAEAEGGHLATITSTAENEFVKSLITEPKLWQRERQDFSSGPWIGGFAKANRKKPVDGWKWITGEAWSFAGWLPGEPSNFLSLETRTHWAFNQTFGWNDTSDAPKLGYVIEIDNYHPCFRGNLIRINQAEGWEREMKQQRDEPTNPWLDHSWSTGRYIPLKFQGNDSVLGSDCPLYLGGAFLAGGIPFFSPIGRARWDGAESVKKTLTVSANVRNVSEVYTLISLAWGRTAADPPLAFIEFEGDKGAFARFPILSGIQARDIWNDPKSEFSDSIDGNFTSFIWRGSTNLILDRQVWRLPLSFQNQVLISVRLVDNGAFGVQGVLLSGITAKVKLPGKRSLH